MKTRCTHGSLRCLGALLLCALLLGLVAVDVEPSHAAIDKYARTDGDFQGTTLRTRGHIDDDCLDNAAPCRSQSDPRRFRAEATAQARALRRLGLGRSEWEVAPGSDTTYAPDWRDPKDPNDPPSGGWRIDIVADGDTLLEVKRWSNWGAGARVQTQVEEQLNGYIRDARAVGVRLEENSELMAAGGGVPWVEAYPDDKGLWWCVWADQTRPGHVYYARVGAAPAWVVTINPSCALKDDQRPPVAPPAYRRLEVQTTAPYTQQNHLHFVAGAAVIAGRELEPEYQYALAYTSADGESVSLGRVTTDAFGGFEQTVTTPNWLLHSDWGTVEAVPLRPSGVSGGVVPPADAPAGAVHVTADC